MVERAVHDLCKERRAGGIKSTEGKNMHIDDREFGTRAEFQNYSTTGASGVTSIARNFPSHALRSIWKLQESHHQSTRPQIHSSSSVVYITYTDSQLRSWESEETKIMRPGILQRIKPWKPAGELYASFCFRVAATSGCSHFRFKTTWLSMGIYTKSRRRETSQSSRWLFTISSAKWNFTKLFINLVLIMSMTSTLVEQVYSYTTTPNSVLAQDLHIGTAINTHLMPSKRETAVSHEIIRHSRRMLLDSSSRARPAPRSFPPPQGNALVITPARSSPPSKPYGDSHRESANSDPKSSSHKGNADHLNPPPHP